MIHRTLTHIRTTPHHVTGTGFESHRMLTAADALGYSLHDTRIAAGAELHLHYANHVESNYVIAGTGSVENVETGEIHALAPGALYVLDGHERHVLRAETDMHLVCVFIPALQGTETHDPSGSYPAA